MGKGLGDKKRWHRGFFSVGIFGEQQNVWFNNKKYNIDLSDFLIFE